MQGDWFLLFKGQCLKKKPTLYTIAGFLLYLLIIIYLQKGDKLL